MSEMITRNCQRTEQTHHRRDNAKRSVAIALRNRWRRMQLNEELRHEVTPKNILMIGPTGVGKTEIAVVWQNWPTRRSSKLKQQNSPKSAMLVKSRFHHPRSDRCCHQNGRVQAIEKNRFRAEEMAEERILDVLIPPAKITGDSQSSRRNLLQRVGHSVKTA